MADAHPMTDDKTHISTCPACGGSTGLERLVVFPGIPAQSAILLESRAEAEAFPKGDLELVFCPACGFAFNARFDPSLVVYGSGYEVSQAGSPTFMKFARELSQGWVDRYGLAGQDGVGNRLRRGRFSGADVRRGRV